MKLWTLMENTACREELQAEHGLSLYLETEDHRILFDTGQSGAFADNAQKLGVDLRQVDICILSHGHYDHGGGLRRFLQINDHAPIYLSPLAFSDCRHGERYIGLDQSLRKCSRLVYTYDHSFLDDGLYLYNCNNCLPERPVESFGLTVGTEPDRFLHEQYLLVEEGGKRILFSGCSHKGVVNLAAWFHPDILVGGFHFKDLNPLYPADAAQLDWAADRLLREKTQYYTCHCTGTAQYDYLRKRMGERLQYLSAGSTVEL